MRTQERTDFMSVGPTGRPRGPWRAVAVPSEHGGWGLTGEPILLGLLVAPTLAGALVGFAGLLAFLARTPLKVCLVDRARDRVLPRTRRAAVVVSIEIAAIAALVVAAVSISPHVFLWPALLAAPLVGLELWFDMRSRSRRLAPELSGAVGIAALAPMVAMAGGADPALAVALWLVLAARAVTSIPWVRRQVLALHGRPDSDPTQMVWDVAAVALAAAAVAVSPPAVVGTLAVFAVIVVQRAMAGSTQRAVILGIRQTALGLAVVTATWAGTFVVAAG